MAFPAWGVGGGSWELRGGGGGGSNGVVEGRGFQRGGRFRLAKRGSFSSTGVLLARDDDNGMKKINFNRTGRFKRSDPDSISFWSNWPDQTKIVTGRRSNQSDWLVWFDFLKPCYTTQTYIPTIENIHNGSLQT